MSSKSILVTEPDHMTRVELRRILEDEGHQVISVTKGIDLLAALETNKSPELIILSSHLLFMNPQELITIIKANSGFRNIPILQIISESDSKLAEVTGFISKPFQKTKLIEFIEKLE